MMAGNSEEPSTGQDDSYACFTLPESFLLSNETPEVVQVSTCEGPVRLAPLEDDHPFEKRQFNGDKVRSLREQILKDNIRLEPTSGAMGRGRGPFELAFVVTLTTFFALLMSGVRGWWLVVLVGATFAALLLGRAQRLGLDLTYVLPNLVRSLVDRLGLLLLLFAALAVAVVVPAIATYYGAGVDEIARLQNGDLVVDSTQYEVLVVRALQVCLIALASLLPALMFFQFRRERFLVIRKRMLHDVFRLDNRLKTLSDLKARYGSQLDTLIESGRRRGGSFRWHTGSGGCTPLIVSTFAVTLGWIFILLDMSGETTKLPPGASPASLITPDGSAFSFAFLGAYFFGLQVVLRGYIRGDLTPKTYNAMTTRILIALILAWLLGALLGEDGWAAQVLCFFAGVLPESVLRWALEKSPVRRTVLPDDVAPLTDLEGMDIYDRSRLADEGITNVQALANHNLVELMLNTRIAVPRLVDWVDQAILYLHVVPPSTVCKGQGTEQTGTDSDRLTLLGRLRTYGIRTATDLIQASRRAKRRHEDPRTLLYQISGEGPDETRPSRLEVALDVLEDDEWMACVRAWRTGTNGPATTRRDNRMNGPACHAPVTIDGTAGDTPVASEATMTVG